MIQILRNTISLLNTGEKRRLVLLVFLTIIINLLDIAALACLVFLVSFLTQPDFSSHSSLVQLFNIEDPFLPLLAFMLFFIFKSIAGYLVFRLQYNFVYDSASRISKGNMMKFLEGTYHDFVNIDSSVMMRRISQQPIEFGQYILQGFQQIFSESVLVIISLSAIAVYNIHLFLLLFLVLVPPVIILAFFSRKILKTARKHVKNSSEKALQHLKEALSGYVESNIYDKKDFFTNRFSRYQTTLNRYLAHLQSVQAMPSRFMEVFAIAGFFILVIANKSFGHSAVIPIASIGAFMAAAYKIIPGIVKIQNFSGQIKTYKYTVDDLLDLNKADIIRNYKPAEQLHTISFKNVSYKHNGNQVIDSLNLSISKGEFIGISGASGIGKTTIINLLIGFLTADKGSISINEIETDTHARQNYWNRIAYVKQQPFMIYDTILNNMVLNDDTHDKEKLAEVISATGLQELLDKFPEGLQKIITENGKNISGGQRQRIAIARALYKDADLIILDEPFNELDTVSEQHILMNIKQLAHGGKMVILITHNEDSLSICDKIYYL